MHEAIERLAHYVYMTHAYDYVDESIETYLWRSTGHILCND